MIDTASKSRRGRQDTMSSMSSRLVILFVTALVFLCVSSARAEILSAEFNGTDPNGGVQTIAGGSHELPGAGTLLFWQDDGAAPVDGQADWVMSNQYGTVLTTVVNILESTDTQTSDPITDLLYEGRTQLISIVTGNNSGTSIYGPDRFNDGSGQFLIFDTDQGAPDHPNLNHPDAAGIVLPDAPGVVFPDPVWGDQRGQVEFNLASWNSGLPLSVQISGIVSNIPDNVFIPSSPEVYALVTADIVAVPSGTVSTTPNPATTRTAPLPITPWPFGAPPPAWNNTLDLGEFVQTFDFSGEVDGVYEIRFTATDVAGRSSPPITETSSAVVTIVIDRGRPVPSILTPAEPFIIGDTPASSPVYEDGEFLLTGQVNDVISLPATVLVTVYNETYAWHDDFYTTTLTSVSPSPWSTGMYLTSTAPGNIGANFPAAGQQEMWVLEVNAIDSVGNESSTTAYRHVIIDLVPTLAPEFSFPPVDYTTSASDLTVRTRIDNNRANSDLEEHGDLIFELTVWPSADPGSRTTYTFNGIGSAGTHPSTLDDAVPAGSPANPLGAVYDEYTGSWNLNLDAWPDGALILSLVTIDQVGNRSPATELRIWKGRQGPVLVVDQTLSGPDDNYDIAGEPSMGQPPNQYGSDDLVFVMSLKSPETEDFGNPPGAVPVPFPPFPNNHDPGTGYDVLFISGTFTDTTTDVATIRAWGPNIPTTSVAITPATSSGSYTIQVDVRNLPEGQPQVCNIQGTNVIGQAGPVTSVVVVRDIVPARAPTVTNPPRQPYFTTHETMVLEGMSEPHNLVAVLTPVTTGAVAVPIDRTANTFDSPFNPIPLVPDSSSQWNSIPASAQVTRADASGYWRFDSLDISTVSTSFLNPTTILIQAVDVYDNTDPVFSVTPFEIFKNSSPGNIARVVVDPGTYRELQVYSAAPAYPPTDGQFRGLEIVEIEVTFDTLIVAPPGLTVTQNHGPGITAGLIHPAPTSTMSTQTLLYQYNVLNTVDSYDGPVLLEFTGGRDIFGNTISPLEIPRSFWVDSVAPVLENATTAAFFPHQGAYVSAVTTLAADIVDNPATVSDALASGFASSVSTVELYGPLENNSDVRHPLAVATPQNPYDIAGSPVSAVTSEGTYRLLVRSLDYAGNESIHYSTFVLDTTPIDESVIVFNPQCESTINEMPVVNGGQAISATVFDLSVDLVQSSVGLSNYQGDVIPLSQSSQGSNVIVGNLLSPLSPDGSDDGLYVMSAEVFDQATNPTPIVTCWFIYDTTPPQILEAFPFDTSCRNDPLRMVHVELADASPVTSNPFSAGVDLDECSISMRLKQAWWPNETRAGTFVSGRRKVRIVDGQPYDILGLEILDPVSGRVRQMASDGTEDGTYEILVSAVDKAGNTTSLITCFDYDTQHPRVMIDDFPEDSFFADSNFTMTGRAFDLGPCGFDHISAPVSSYSTTVIQVRIEQLDSRGVARSPITTPFFDFQNVDMVVPAPGSSSNSLVQDLCAWQITRRIPDRAGPARITVRAIDAAGNETRITRDITIKAGTLAAPVLRYPEDNDVVGDKVITFRWDPLLIAHRYDLELTRVTPSGVTTSTTFAVPFPTSKLVVDLPLFCSTMPGGAPLDDASVFSWRMRSFDVSGNGGDYGEPFLFTVDPNRPSVIDVFFNGRAASPSTVVSAGLVEVQVDFDDEVGMDTSRPPVVTIIPRDSDIAPVSVSPASFTTLTWTGAFELPFGSPEDDPNGPATLVIRDAYDMAGNPMPETTAPFFINTGPWFDARVFPNPVNPPELIFTMVARYYEGGPTVAVPYTVFPVNPRVDVRQHGKSNWREYVSVYPVPQTTSTTAVYRGSYTIDRDLIGQVDFQVTAADEAGRTCRRNFSINVVDALAREGVLFWGATAGTHLAVPPMALAADSLIYSMKEANGPPLPSKAAAVTGLARVRSLGWYLPAGVGLKQDAHVYASLASLGSLPYKARQMAIYRWDGDKWKYCDSASSARGITATTRRLGAFAVMADTEAPVLSDPEPSDPGQPVSRSPRLSVAVDEAGSGVEPTGAVFVIDGKSYAGTWDSQLGRAWFEPGRPLKAGEHTASVTVKDRAGNTSSPLVFSFASALSIDVGRPIAYPSPARSATTIRYTLNQAAEEVRVRIFDTSGSLVRRFHEGPLGPGVQETRWNLCNGRGRLVSNGVYIFRVEARGADGTKSRRLGKVAVLR